MSATTASNLDICTRAQLELFGAGRLELAEELIAPDCVDHGAGAVPARLRRRADRKASRAWCAGFAERSPT